MGRLLSFKNKRRIFKIGLSIKQAGFLKIRNLACPVSPVCGFPVCPFFLSTRNKHKNRQFLYRTENAPVRLAPASLQNQRRWFIPPWMPQCCQRTRRRRCSAAMRRAVPALHSGYRRTLHPSELCGTPAASPSDRQSRRKVPADTA